MPRRPDSYSLWRGRFCTVIERWHQGALRRLHHHRTCAARIPCIPGLVYRSCGCVHAVSGLCGMQKAPVGIFNSAVKCCEFEFAQVLSRHQSCVKAARADPTCPRISLVLPAVRRTPGTMMTAARGSTARLRPQDCPAGRTPRPGRPCAPHLSSSSDGSPR